MYIVVKYQFQILKFIQPTCLTVLAMYTINVLHAENQVDRMTQLAIVFGTITLMYTNIIHHSLIIAVMYTQSIHHTVDEGV